MQNADLVITFFSSRLLQAGLSCQCNSHGNHQARGRCTAQRQAEGISRMKFKYVEEAFYTWKYAQGAFYPLCLVSGLQLSCKPVLEPTGYPPVHNGFRLGDISHP